MKTKQSNFFFTFIAPIIHLQGIYCSIARATDVSTKSLIDEERKELREALNDLRTQQDMQQHTDKLWSKNPDDPKHEEREVIKETIDLLWVIIGHEFARRLLNHAKNKTELMTRYKHDGKQLIIESKPTYLSNVLGTTFERYPSYYRDTITNDLRGLIRTREHLHEYNITEEDGGKLSNIVTVAEGIWGTLVEINKIITFLEQYSSDNFTNDQVRELMQEIYDKNLKKVQCPMIQEHQKPEDLLHPSYKENGKVFPSVVFIEYMVKMPYGENDGTYTSTYRALVSNRKILKHINV